MKIKSFIFETGHQELKITYALQKNEQDGFCTLHATFNDQSRGINGKVNIPFVFPDSTNREIGALVQRAYDQGNYTNA